MAAILVTGGTGTLGRALVMRLREQGHEPRVLSRRAGPGATVGDLETGEGVAGAVRGADVVVHAASRPRHDVAQARTLLDALRDEGRRAAATPHLVFVSIVGVDRVPLAYYRDKVAVERMVAEAGVPWTVQRATQFHDLLVMLFGVLGRAPVLPVLAGARFQPVDVRDVAERLAALAVGAPAGRAEDLAGPQVRTMADLARAWASATGRRRVVVPVPLPGAPARAVRAGALLAPDHADGRITFEEFLGAARAGAR
jgi:uncharacterized protein YbjT (DUF2867 family)